MPKNKVTKKAPKKANVAKKAPTKKKATPKKPQASKKVSEPKAKVKLVSTKQGLIEVKVKPQSEEKKDTRKYVKVYEDDPLEKRKEVRERVYRKELKFAYYASDGPRGVWYYIVV